jgi:hypothetical protein
MFTGLRIRRTREIFHLPPAHVDRDGQRTVVIVVVDIMTGKRAEEALPASESRLRELAVQLEHRVAERPRELEHSHSRLS